MTTTSTPWPPRTRNSRALYRETRRIGLPDGTLHARPAAPLYLTMPAWSRATIGLAYAAALIIAGRYDEAVQVLSDPVITDDTQAAQWHQFIAATVYFATQRWPDVREAQRCHRPRMPPTPPIEVSAAVAALSASAAASLGQVQAALALVDTISTANPVLAADVALTRGMVPA